MLTAGGSVTALNLHAPHVFGSTSPVTMSCCGIISPAQRGYISLPWKCFGLDFGWLSVSFGTKFLAPHKLFPSISFSASGPGMCISGYGEDTQ